MDTMRFTIAQNLQTKKNNNLSLSYQFSLQCDYLAKLTKSWPEII